MVQFWSIVVNTFGEEVTFHLKHVLPYDWDKSWSILSTTMIQEENSQYKVVITLGNRED